MPTATRSTKTDKFGKSTRTYDTPHGKFVSVTTALQVMPKPFLIAWAAKLERAYVIEAATKLYVDLQGLGESEHPGSWFASTVEARLGKTKAHKLALETAGDVGTQAHAYCENFNRVFSGGPHISLPPLADPEQEGAAMHAYTRYVVWAGAVGFKPTHVEQIVYSKTHRYAGCLDVRGTVEGVDTLVDLKTSTSVWPEAHVQTSAYAYAHEEMGIQFPRQILIVRLPKKVGETEVEVVRVEDPAKEFRTFLAALALWRCLNRKGEE